MSLSSLLRKSHIAQGLVFWHLMSVVATSFLFLNFLSEGEATDSMIDPLLYVYRMPVNRAIESIYYS
jgi:hypothetical protein